MDSPNPELNPAIVFEYLDRGHFTGNVKRYRRIVNRERGVELRQGQGETVYIGGRLSSRMMRVYDKATEVFQTLQKVIPHLTRFELEVKREAADRVFRAIAEKSASVIPGFFSGWINFKNPFDCATRVARAYD